MRVMVNKCKNAHELAICSRHAALIVGQCMHLIFKSAHFSVFVLMKSKTSLKCEGVDVKII